MIILLDQSYKAILRPIIRWLLVLAAITITSYFLPPVYSTKTISSFIPIHTLFETISIVISMMVFAVCWGVPIKDRAGNFLFLASVFFGVALIDFLHTLSYNGTPIFFSEKGSGIVIQFWLAGRALSAIGMFIVAIVPWKALKSEKTRWIFLGLILTLVSIVTWRGLFQTEWIPDAYIEGPGLTQLKFQIEIFLVSLYFLNAFLFFRKMGKPRSYDVVGLFAASSIMGMSEFLFTIHVVIGDVYNVLGHIYKVIAYVFVYRSIFIDSIKLPLKKLNESNKNLEQEISDRKKIERLLADNISEINKVTDNLRSALSARDEFLIIASHELKTPITSLKLRLQMIQRQLFENDKMSKEMNIVLNQVDRLTKLINTILDVSRIQSGKFTLELAPVNLAGIVDLVLEQFSEQLANSKSQIEVKISPEVVGVWDQARLEQVLNNLLSNAIKYAPGGKISILATQDALKTTLIFKDTGPGIPKEKLSLLFERYERAGAPLSVSGLGLGLFICKQIIEAHCGTIHAESQEGHGTLFTIELPNISPPILCREL